MNTPDYDDLREHTDTVVLPVKPKDDADVDDEATTSGREDETSVPHKKESQVFLT